MPEPQADPHLPQTRRVAMHALVAGVVITILKFGVFALTNSVAVLSDALESIINVAAATMVIYVLWLSSRPADREHPYGHGKAEVLAVGLEGWMILFAGIVILYEAVKRLIFGNPLAENQLVLGWWLLLGIGLLSAALATYVYRAGKRYDNATLLADGKHLLTDVASTAAVLVGLGVVHLTGRVWLDPLIAIVIAACILYVSWRLLWQSAQGVLDRSDPEDDKRIHRILDEEVAAGAIGGYHKVRCRRTGHFRWVDMHLHVQPDLTVAQSHDLASRIERKIEAALGHANATAHVEPLQPSRQSDAGAAPPSAAAGEPGHGASAAGEPASDGQVGDEPDGEPEDDGDTYELSEPRG